MLKKENFNTFPLGAINRKIPYSPIITHKTTLELVSDRDSDSHYFRALERQGIFLNPSQLEGVRAFNGPHLIIAGAGSGKTRVLTTRAGYLLTYDTSIRPNNIMLVTFTRKAAEEMINRIQMLPGISKRMAYDMVSGTFHSIFLKVLRNNRYEQRILANEKWKGIMIKGILKEERLLDSYEPETILSSISSYKANLLRPQDIKPLTPIEREIQTVYARYEYQKKQKQYLDFDDILVESYFLLSRNKALLEKIQNQIRYIQIDEYQDVNKVQHELIKLIVQKPKENVFFVGDEDQVIYNFRYASPDYILNLSKEYPNLKTITLDTNYRSTDSIVGLGNEIIKFNRNRLGKQLKATKTSNTTPFYMRPAETYEEAKQIAENIQDDVELGRRNYKDFAILYRTHNISRAIFDEFVLRNIPFITKNEQVFYDRPMVKPVLDYLRLSLNPNDVKAIEGIAPTMYLNKEKILHVLETNMGHENKNLLRALLKIPGLKPFQIQQFYARIEFIEILKTRSPADAIREVRKGLPKYDEYLETDERKTLTLHKEFIRETMDELEASAVRFSSLQEYLEFVSKIISKNKQMEDLRKKPNADAIQLMTIHSAKGLEFPVVYVIGFSDTIMPHASAYTASEQQDCTILSEAGNQQLINNAMEEERRLAYVSVTRAQEKLYISSPKVYRNKDVAVSPFLLEAFGAYHREGISK